MRIVVSGTHASGKSTLIADFHEAHPEYPVLPDPFEDLDLDDPASESSFAVQLRLTASRLAETATDGDVIAERGPLDFLAYLTALERLGRSDGRLLARASEIVAESLEPTDLIVIVALDANHPIHVPADEDPELRAEMDQALLELADEFEQEGAARFLTVGGSPASRLGSVQAAAHR